MITIQQNGTVHAFDREDDFVTLCGEDIDFLKKRNEFAVSCPKCLKVIEEKFAHLYKTAGTSALSMLIKD